MAGLFVRETTGSVRLARGGRLLPWLGPAVRGMIGGRLRARACRWPVADVLARWERCGGCPRMGGCAYGETYEPDPPAGVELAAGWEQAARPISIGVGFPAPELGRAGDRFDVRVTAVGRVAAAHLDAVWEALRVAGADLAIGLGDDHIPFDVDRIDTADHTVELPAPNDRGEPVMMRVALTAPLFLAERTANGRKQTVRQPTFGQLLRAGLRALGPLHRLYGEPLPDGVFAAVKAAAEGVPTARAGFTPFHQGRFSHRTKERYDASGVVGWAEYGPAPEWLLPWLAWAGRLRVGTHRIAGAGGWDISLPSGPGAVTPDASIRPRR